jgi:DNA-binding NarL/FixJ family response regulator
MESLVKSSLLAVGVNGRTEALNELPIRLVSARSAGEAIRHIRDDRFESVLSRWDLEDMPAGLFLKKLRLVRPDMSTIVLICGKDEAEEISARSIGVSAVLTDDCSDEFLLATVASVLGIAVPAEIAAITRSASRAKDGSRAGVIR